MLVADFDYELPAQLIAQYPIEPRDSSRLMIVDRKKQTIVHDHFFNILKYIDHNDQFVFNDTKVMPARLYGQKESGSKIEILLLKQTGSGWSFIGKNIGRAKKLFFEDGYQGEIVDGLIFFNKEDVFTIGHVPLPPYMPQDDALTERYQTVYANEEKSAAAPTAGLHFTPELFGRIPNKEFVTLHVGLGTFLPLKQEIVEENHLHEEYYNVNKFEKKVGQNVVAVGTTTVRVLESYAKSGERFGHTDIFIYPPYEFKLVDKLITNFHLPKSSLLMLVCAFGGRDLIMKAYYEAVKEKYRFFSFGDAMLIV